MSFRILPLPLDAFRPLFAMDDAALESIGARRMIADAPHSAPCRVSLADAEPGEPLILLSHRHLDDPSSPYRSEGPIFVRQTATEAAPAPGVVPEMLSRRLLSVRIYDADWMMIDADVVEGAELAGRLRDWFKSDTVALAHVHTARRGCYMASVVRA